MKNTPKPPPLSLAEFAGTAYLAGDNANYLEILFEEYKKSPDQLSPAWQACFKRVASEGTFSHAAIAQTYLAVTHQNHTEAHKEEGVGQVVFQVALLMEAFRRYGHLAADLDPLGLKAKSGIPELDLATYGLQATDLQTTVNLKGQLGLEKVTLATVLERLKSLYCNSIGYEYQHILDHTQRNWLMERIESPQQTPVSVEEKKRILQRLIESEGLEKHLAAQFVAQKRFSIEGGDALMPMLDTLVIQAAQQGTEHVVLGMGHRGRLNVLINLMGKPPAQLFEEFQGKYTEDSVSGDVKYHKGFESNLNTPGGTLQASLAYNPSHLETVDPVVEGIARAKQDQSTQARDQAYQKVLPILMHGDAAFSGQGMIMELLQLSQTKAYGTGGTIHIISNNQIGFTTNPGKARSSRYCTDIAKMIEAPIFHINGDDPEAACYAIALALQFRNQFKKDVVIDLMCYRRYGHNEADEPAATQPLMYATIRKHPALWLSYAERLEAEGVLKIDEAKALLAAYRKRVATGDPVAAWVKAKRSSKKTEANQDWRAGVETAVAQHKLQAFTGPLTQLPEGMHLQTQVGKLISDRKKMIEGNLPMNWGTAENLAYASLLSEGFTVRLTGQDCERGTFSHRHTVWHDYKTGETYTPLSTLVKASASLTISDSILSELAVMGFEYGYACEQAKALVIWEAQYGDFVNGAQMIIDQFISSAEQKWEQQSSLVLFLPHGYEGSGPEHSSARPERFLQLCAQENLQVCMPTTPAQQFHLLRRQVLRNYRKALVVMTPKSLLRHKQATSTLDELAKGSFQAVIASSQPVKHAKRVIFCSGKVYYELRSEQANTPLQVEIIRLEQLYPFPDQELKAILALYAQVTDFIWCQEEPQNQGAWQWIQSRLQNCLPSGALLRYVGRPEAASPAVGSPIRHEAEQKTLVKACFSE